MVLSIKKEILNILFLIILSIFSYLSNNKTTIEKKQLHAVELVGTLYCKIISVYWKEF